MKKAMNELLTELEVLKQLKRETEDKRRLAYYDQQIERVKNDMRAVIK